MTMRNSHILGFFLSFLAGSTIAFLPLLLLRVLTMDAEAGVEVEAGRRAVGGQRVGPECHPWRTEADRFSGPVKQIIEQGKHLPRTRTLSTRRCISASISASTHSSPSGRLICISAPRFNLSPTVIDSLSTYDYATRLIFIFIYIYIYIYVVI